MESVYFSAPSSDVPTWMTPFALPLPLLKTEASDVLVPGVVSPWSTIMDDDFEFAASVPLAPAPAALSLPVPVAAPAHASPARLSPSSDAAEIPSAASFAAAQREAFDAVAAHYAQPADARPKRAVTRKIVQKAASSSLSDDGSVSAPRSRGAGRSAPSRARAAAGRSSSSASSANGCAPHGALGKVKVANLTEEERIVYRRLKNREASQLSRDRKRQRLEILEAEVADQKAIVAQVEHERNQALCELSILRNELSTLRARLATFGAL